jgi:putative DNA primase/helicase
MRAAETISRMLAERAEALVMDLLPNGRRDGAEWRIGSTLGEPGNSLSVRLIGKKSGVWADFATGQNGDALDLVREVLGVDMPAAMRWACHWLGIEPGGAPVARRPALPPKVKPIPNPGAWRKTWQAGRPIAGTLAELYLAARRLSFGDPDGCVLRFHPRAARLMGDERLEHHPAMLALLSDVMTGEPCGIVKTFLRPDGGDRLRDPKGKTTSGRQTGAAMMLSTHAEPTYGLVACEGCETGIALHMAGLRPVWACGGASVLRSMPPLAGIQCLTVAADADAPGRAAATALAESWLLAGKEVATIEPPVAGADWADRPMGVT